MKEKSYDSTFEQEYNLFDNNDNNNSNNNNNNNNSNSLEYAAYNMNNNNNNMNNPVNYDNFGYYGVRQPNMALTMNSINAPYSSNNNNNNFQLPRTIQSRKLTTVSHNLNTNTVSSTMATTTTLTAPQAYNKSVGWTADQLMQHQQQKQQQMYAQSQAHQQQQQIYAHSQAQQKQQPIRQMSQPQTHQQPQSQASMSNNVNVNTVHNRTFMGQATPQPPSDSVDPLNIPMTGNIGNDTSYDSDLNISLPITPGSTSGLNFESMSPMRLSKSVTMNSMINNGNNGNNNNNNNNNVIPQSQHQFKNNFENSKKFLKNEKCISIESVAKRNESIAALEALNNEDLLNLYSIRQQGLNNNSNNSHSSASVEAALIRFANKPTNIAAARKEGEYNGSVLETWDEHKKEVRSAAAIQMSEDISLLHESMVPGGFIYEAGYGVRSKNALSMPDEHHRFKTLILQSCDHCAGVKEDGYCLYARRESDNKFQCVSCYHELCTDVIQEPDKGINTPFDERDTVVDDSQRIRCKVTCMYNKDGFCINCCKYWLSDPRLQCDNSLKAKFMESHNKAAMKLQEENKNLSNNNNNSKDSNDKTDKLGNNFEKSKIIIEESKLNDKNNENNNNMNSFLSMPDKRVQTLLDLQNWRNFPKKECWLCTKEICMRHQCVYLPTFVECYRCIHPLFCEAPPNSNKNSSFNVLKLMYVFYFNVFFFDF